jgi:hypothetical protein
VSMMPVCLYALAKALEGSVPDDVGYAFSNIKLLIRYPCT